MRKQILNNRKWLVYVGLVGFFCFGIYLAITLVAELTQVNYGFRGTHYDFIAFYSAAHGALNDGIKNIYDMAVVSDFQKGIIPHPIGASGYMPFLNPPFLAVLLSPLALFSITTARLIWLFITIVLGVFSLYKLTDSIIGNKRLLAALLMLGSFPVYQTLVQGQVTILALFGCTISYIYLKKDKQVLSGAGLVSLLIFPQFAAMVLVALLYKRRWQMLKGWLAASGVLMAFTLPYTGLNLYITYIKMLVNVTQNHFIDLTTSAQLTWRGNLDASSGLNGFFSSMLGPNLTTISNILYVVSAVLFIGWLYIVVRKVGSKYSAKQGAYIYIASVLTALLISPHLFSQGIVFVFLLLPALLSLYKKSQVQAVVLVASLANVVYVDQYLRLHFFAIIALLMTIYFLNMALSNKKAPS